MNDRTVSCTQSIPLKKSADRLHPFSTIDHHNSETRRHFDGMQGCCGKTAATVQKTDQSESRYSRKSIDILNVEIGDTVDELYPEIGKSIHKLPAAASIRESVDTLHFQIGKHRNERNPEIGESIHNLYLPIQLFPFERTIFPDAGSQRRGRGESHRQYRDQDDKKTTDFHGRQVIERKKHYKQEEGTITAEKQTTVSGNRFRNTLYGLDKSDSGNERRPDKRFHIVKKVFILRENRTEFLLRS